MSGILFKVIVERFYKLNSGFFLLFFILLFGLLDGKSTMDLHHAIMEGITSSWLFMCIAAVVWMAYNFKCISFAVKELNEPQNTFLYQLQCTGNRPLYLLLFLTHAAIYLPLLVYGSVTVIVGIQQHHYLLSAMFIFFQLAATGTGAYIYFQKISTTWQQPLVKLPSFDIFGTKNFSSYLLHYSLHYRKRTFIGVKFFSLLLLQAMVAANSSKVSKEAICLLIMFLISAHSLLPAYYVRFVEHGMPFLRNMPVSIMKRYGVYALTYAVIFLPELCFLLINAHHTLPLQLTLSLYAMAVSQSLLYTGIQYLRNMQAERYNMIVFGIFFITLLLLASLNLWIVFAVELVVATVLFIVNYDRYEPAIEG